MFFIAEIVEWSVNKVQRPLILLRPYDFFCQKTKKNNADVCISKLFQIYSKTVDVKFWFSGGDISIIGGKSSGCDHVPRIEPGSEDGPPSPLVSGEFIVSGCIEVKIAERSNENIMGQKVSNMTVCVAKSLETVTASDLKSIKVA